MTAQRSTIHLSLAMLVGVGGLTLALTALAPVVALVPVAHAQTSRSRLLKLLARRPATVRREAWRAQRREAARELGRLRERRAVPILLSIISKERFDVILEIAIDALGNIGDRRAVEPLKRLLNDPSLDAYVRDAVAGSLKKLGSSHSTGGTSRRTRRTGKGPNTKSPDTKSPDTKSPGPKDPGDEPPTVSRGFGDLPPLTIEEFPEDLLGRSSRIDILLGDARLDWDGRTDRARFDLDVGGRYLLQEELKTVGMTMDGAVSLGFQTIDSAGDDDGIYNLKHQLQINPEIRYYPFQKDLPALFGQLSGSVGYSLRLESPPNTLDNAFRFASTLAVAVAPGYGRILDVSSRLRLQRIVRVLRRAGLFEKVVAVDPDTANQLATMWYTYRNSLGSFKRLGYTLSILRKASLLKGEVDPATAYRIIRILDDPQLFDRKEGHIFRLGYGYARTLVLDGPDDDHGYLFSTASYHKQQGTTREWGAEAKFFWSHLGTPDSYAVTVDAYYRWHRYNRAFDPLGSYGLTLSTGITQQRGGAFKNSDIGYRVLGGLTYGRFASAGSQIVAAINGGVDNRGGLVLVTLEARLGIAQASVAGVGN